MWNYFRYRTGQLDEAVVGVMAEYYGVTRQTEAERLLQWGYGTHTCIYFLLLNRYPFLLLNMYLFLLLTNQGTGRGHFELWPSHLAAIRGVHSGVLYRYLS